jgi:hypothetical protein
MKTPLEEIIHWIEVRMSLYPDEPNVSERGAYDAYFNILIMAKSKLVYEKKIMQNIFEGISQNVGTSIKKEDLPTFEDWYKNTFK